MWTDNPIVRARAMVTCGPACLVTIALLCGSCHSPPSSGEWDRQELAGYEEQSSMGYSMADVVRTSIGRFDGSLVWVGSNAGFTLSTVSGDTAGAEVTLEPRNESVFEVTPCDPDAAPAVGNHVNDCRKYLETALGLEVRSSDGQLSENLIGTVRAYSLEEWVYHVSTPELGGTFRVIDGPEGSYTFVFHMNYYEQTLKSRFAGVVAFAVTKDESGGEAAGGTGFTGAEWNAELTRTQ